jgi:hypothetical protein
MTYGQTHTQPHSYTPEPISQGPVLGISYQMTGIKENLKNSPKGSTQTQ